MKTKGIRINDSDNGIITVKLYDILNEIENGDLFYWSILYLYAIGKPDLNGKDYLQGEHSLPVLEEKIYESKSGIIVSWEELNLFSKRMHQIIDITIIGCKNYEMIRKYSSEQDMYESCDIVIEMIDGGCWEVFSFNHYLIERLNKKFKKKKFLNSDFLN